MNLEVFIDNSGHEYKKHGTNDYPVDFNISRGLGFPLHFHDEIEIINVIEGILSITVNNKKYLLNVGDSIFINSGIPHELNFNNEIRYVSNDTEFNPIFLSGDNNIIYDKYILPFINSDIDCIILRKDNPNDKDMLDDIVTLFSLNNKDISLKEFRIRNILSEIFIKAYERCKNNISKKNNDYKYDNIKLAISFIKDNYQNDIKLEDISNIMGLSNREAQRLFKTYLGISPYKCVLKERLANSALLLLNSSLSISEICFKCGFKDTSSFINQFKNYYGKTPGQYRNI